MKRNLSKLLALLLCMLLCVFAPIAYAAETEDEKPLYEESFDKDLSDMTETEIWEITGDRSKVVHDPGILGGVLRIASGGGVKFNWTKTENLGEYSPEMRYSFAFDVSFTDPKIAEPSILSVSFGSTAHQVRIDQKSAKITVGDSSDVEYISDDFSDKTVHVTVSLEGNTVRSTLSDRDGYVIAHGESVSEEYTKVTEATMSSLVIKCEGGAIELNNFSLSENLFSQVSKTLVDVPVNFAATYKLDLTCDSASESSIKFDEVDIFSYSYGSLRVCDTDVVGSYPGGKYSVSVYICPTQRIMYADVSIPGGDLLKRGTYELTEGSELCVYSYALKPFDKIHFDYEIATEDIEEDPNAEEEVFDINAPIFNIVSSFSDPLTTRSFAWTVRRPVLGDADTVLKYREKGTEEWIEATSVKEIEEIEILAEDYYKADIFGLKPETEYEYTIASKSSVGMPDINIGIYSFTTSCDDLDEFTFLAFGDTQFEGIDADMLHPGKYDQIKSVIDEAIKNIGDPAFILHTGNVVDDPADLEEWNAYLGAIQNHSISIPHFAAMGGCDGDPFSHHFNHKSDTSFGEGEKLPENVYSFDYGDAHFAVLNSSAYKSGDVYIPEEQKLWLEKDLAANKNAKWKIILVNDDLSPEESVKEKRSPLYDVIEDHGVDLVIRGNSDTYSRSHPMKGGKIESKSAKDSIEKGKGTIYTTLSSIGQSKEKRESMRGEEYLCAITPDKASPAYTAVTVKEDKVVVTTKQLDGFVLDDFSIVDTTPRRIQLNSGEIVGIIVGPAIIAAICGALLIAADNKKKKNKNS